jgi:hypothetical protein
MLREYPELKEQCETPRDAFVICAASLTFLLGARKQDAISQKRTLPAAGRILPKKDEKDKG